MNFEGWLIFVVVLCLITITGFFRSRQINTESLYLLAGRKTKLFALIATLVMTEFNTATLIAFTSAGYRAYWWALTLPGVFLIGLLFYAFTVAKKWKEFNGLSVAQFFLERYGKEVSYLVRIVLFCAMAGFSATYVKALMLIFSPLLPVMNVWISSALLSFIVLLICWRGGLMAIIRTDIVSFVIVLVFFPLLLWHVWHGLPVAHALAPQTMSHMQQALPVKFVISLVFLTMFSYILAPWYGQKIVSADSTKTAVLAVVIAAILIFLLYGCAVITTARLAHQGIVLGQSDQALPFVIQHALPPALQGFGYAVLFLAASTTLSGVWSAMVTLLIHHRGNQTAHFNLYRDMGLTGACALLSYFLANVFVDQIFNKMILANIPVVALAFSLLAGFYWKKASQLGVYASIITGLSWGIGCYYYFGEAHLYTWYWAIYGIPLSFLMGIVGSLVTHYKFQRKMLTNI